MSDFSLDPNTRWDIFLTTGFAKDCCSLHCTADQLGRIWDQLRNRYEEVTERIPSLVNIEDVDPSGLKLFGLDVVIVESIESPTLLPSRHFETGVEAFARQLSDRVVPVSAPPEVPRSEVSRSDREDGREVPSTKPISSVKGKRSSEMRESLNLRYQGFLKIMKEEADAGHYDRARESQIRAEELKWFLDFWL